MAAAIISSRFFRLRMSSSSLSLAAGLGVFGSLVIRPFAAAFSRERLSAASFSLVGVAYSRMILAPFVAGSRFKFYAMLYVANVTWGNDSLVGQVFKEHLPGPV